MLGQYLDNCIYVLITSFLADLSIRMFKMVWEVFNFANHYLPDERLRQIIVRSFSYDKSAIVFWIITCLIGIFRFCTSVRFSYKAAYLAFIPLWWLLCAVKFNHTSLDYAYWIREKHGLDYAEGMASSYFHGYLKLTLPNFGGHLGIRERIKLYSAQQRVQFAIDRLVILIPNTMFINSKIESTILEKANSPLKAVIKNRAGAQRLYQNDVYRFKRPINGTIYYVTLEGATPLLSFFEAMHFQLTATWQMKEMQREILFKFYRHLKKLLREWPETQREAELVLYNAYTNDGRLQDVGEVLLAHITNLWHNGRA